MTVTQKLNPTMRQKGFLARATGTARRASNWGLHPCERLLNAGRPVPRPAEPHRVWDAGKPRRSWVCGVSKRCGLEAPRDPDRAFANFWRGREEGRRIGFPRFRKKHGRRDPFWLTGSIHAHPRSVSLARIGCVRTKKAVEHAVKKAVEKAINEATTKFRDRILSEAVGVDLDRKSFAVLSDGARPLVKAQRRLCYRQRLHNRKQLGGRNRRKSAAGLARPHRRSHCQRTDFPRKATTELAETKAVIRVEDLSGRSMNRHLARSIADADGLECRRMLESMPPWYGSQRVIAPRFYLSTEACSSRGHVKAGMPLGERGFPCEACRAEVDRETVSGCGAAGSGRENCLVNPAAVKQESRSRELAACAAANNIPEERNGTA